ncbi:GyrI-like domain-containing protein [Asticcacaulis sp. W401b]|uniref:AraC family transcriptional regulator n=1 Tax=Asticcacaulis sp. W401b TaxID=3388666 RepID=UPI0039709486
MTAQSQLTPSVDYAQRIERVLKHLEATDFTEVPDLDEMAGIAALSPFHFHRIYRLMTGETPAETIRRIRLARATGALEHSIGEATQAAGYATSQAFARALKSETGHTASEIRQSESLREGLSHQLRRPAIAQSPLAVEIVEAEPLTLTALRNTGAYPQLNAVYQRLFDLVFSQLPIEDLGGLYGYQHDDPRCTPLEACRAEVAVDVGGKAELIEDLYHIVVPGGLYARLRHYGDYDAVQPTMDALYLAAIDAGYALADQPLHLHFLDDPEEVATADLRCDLYLPLNVNPSA